VALPTVLSGTRAVRDRVLALPAPPSQPSRLPRRLGVVSAQTEKVVESSTGQVMFSPVKL